MNFTYTNELYHHGVNGMKWGVRRYQNEDGSLTPEGRVHYGYNSETRRYSRELNRLDKSTIRDKRQLIESRKRENRFNNKLNKIVKKNTKDGVLNVNGRTSDKIAKYRAEIDAERAKADVYRKRIEEVEAKAKNIIDEAESKGYSVNSKDVMRFNTTGKDIVKSIVGTTAGGLAANILRLPLSPVYVSGEFIEGKQYKVNTVKNDKPSNQTDTQKKDSNSGPKYTPEQKQAKMERAKNDDTYDLLFLEAIQNSKILYDNDTKAIQKEYSAYLDDPKDYFLNKSKRLEQE